MRVYLGGARDGKWCTSQDPVNSRGPPNKRESKADCAASDKTSDASSPIRRVSSCQPEKLFRHTYLEEN